MRTFASENCNIAWFQLADFVARGQKERALHMYRLLMHSIEDKAISFQLEGDILASFSDVGATDKYLLAINIYKNSGKFQQAISLCLRAHSFKESIEVSISLFHLYCLTYNLSKAVATFSSLTKLCFQRNAGERAQKVFETFMIETTLFLPSSSLDNLRFSIAAQFVIELLINNSKSIKTNLYLLQAMQLFEQCMRHNDRNGVDLQKFLSELSAINYDFYQQAQNYLCQSV